MSSEDVKALERGFEALERGDLEVLLSLVDPEFEVGHRMVPEGRSGLRGPDALTDNVSQIREVFGDVSWHPQEVIDLDGRLLVRVRLEATAQHTALPFDEDIGQIHTLRNGRMLRLDVYRTWEEARLAAGLPD
jgi:ketosteroid isomerase-like protein